MFHAVAGRVKYLTDSLATGGHQSGGFLSLFNVDVRTVSLDLSIGRYVSDLLTNWSWILRRVEHVRLPDSWVAERRISVDIDCQGLRQRAASSHQPLSQELFRDPNRVLAPIAVLRKDLLMDFDLVDRAGTALSLPTRDEDAFVAACVLAYRCQESLGPDDIDQFRDKLFNVAYSFPVDESEVVELLAPDASWSSSLRAKWEEGFLQTRNLELVLDFLDNFLLLTEVNLQEASHLVKFSYQGPVDWGPTGAEQLGFVPSDVSISAPGTGQARSYHLRLDAPEGLVLTDATLAHDRLEHLTFLRKLVDTRAHLYVSRVAAIPSYRADFKVRAPKHGFLRTAKVATTFTFSLLLFVAIYFVRFRQLVADQADAMIAFLFTVPLVLAAYVVRPKEHDMVMTLLRPSRFLVAASALPPFIASICLLPQFHGWPSRAIIYGMTTAAGVICAIVWIVHRRTKRDVDRAETGAVQRLTVQHSPS